MEEVDLFRERLVAIEISLSFFSHDNDDEHS